MFGLRLQVCVLIDQLLQHFANLRNLVVCCRSTLLILDPSRPSRSRKYDSLNSKHAKHCRRSFWWAFAAVLPRQAFRTWHWHIAADSQSPRPKQEIECYLNPCSDTYIDGVNIRDCKDHDMPTQMTPATLKTTSGARDGSRFALHRIPDKKRGREKTS